MAALASPVVQRQSEAVLVQAFRGGSGGSGSGPAVQLSSMRVSSPSDPAEREASAVAHTVVNLRGAGLASPRMGGSGTGSGTGAGSGVLRRAGPAPIARQACAAAVIQRSATPAAASGGDVPARIQSSLAGGTPLPASVRRFMEPRFKASFADVRIHTDANAATLSRQLAAQAFTTGNHIFFARDQFQPETAAGRELIAHELAHTIQQSAVIQRRQDVRVSQTVPVQIQRAGGAVQDFIADKVNLIPGFRMFTLVLGVNPITMNAVDASPANILRAVIEFIPGGALVTQALDSSGVFEKVAAWAAQQIKSLGMAGATIKLALSDFLSSLSVWDLGSLGSVWDRAKAIFTGPIDRIKNLVKGFVTGIVEFVKDAILKPIAKLAEGTPSYDLLKGVMGKDPITGEPVADSAELLIGGFMKLIGQQEVWDNMKKSGAVPKAWAWFKGALSELKAFVLQIPPTFMAAFKSLVLADIVLLPRAFAKLAGVFGTFLGKFLSWAGNAVWSLLEIVVKAVNPGAWEYIQKTGAALKSILQNPLPFLGNLVAAGKGGFSAFGGNFLTHLKKGLIDWLTGSLDGVYIPTALTLGEIVKFVFSVLGLTYARFRVKMVTAFGEPTVLAIEKGFALLKTLVTEGPAAAWEQLKGELSALKDQVIEGIKGLVIEAVITKGIPKLVAMFIPGAGFIGAIISIYDTVMVIVNQVAKIVAVVKSFVDSIVAIANGNIGAAISKVESVLATGLSLAINFFAAFAGLGKISAKINGVIQKIRAPVDKAMDSLIGWVKKVSKSFIDKLAGKDAPPEEKQKRVEKAAAAGLAAVSKFSGKAVGEAILKPILLGIKVIHRVTTLIPVKEGDYWSIRAEINPVKTVKTQVKVGKATAEMEVGYEPHWPLDEFMSKANAIKAAAEGKTTKQAQTLGFEKGSKTKRKSTKELREGGQDKFRAEIHAYISQITVATDRSKATGLMDQLQADHQQELQMGGTDTEENMAMIESRMNSQMGGMWRGQLKDLLPETKIIKVKVETKKGTAKGQGHRKSGAAAELQALLLKHAKRLKVAAVTITDWFFK